jgi:hypothetical protein
LTFRTTDELTPVLQKRLAVNRVTALILEKKKKLQPFIFTQDILRKAQMPCRKRVLVTGSGGNLRALLRN